jgi:hypothetical protein
VGVGFGTGRHSAYRDFIKQQRKAVDEPVKPKRKFFVPSKTVKL